LDDQSNPNGNPGQSNPPSISFGNIVDFLKEHQRQVYSRETEWLFEKSQMQQRIHSLEGQLRAQENINQDMIKRIKMLEFSLRQERLKYAKMASQGGQALAGQTTDIIGDVI
jgi:striatin 1/3/4